jgi:hypothetical protein
MEALCKLGETLLRLVSFIFVSEHHIGSVTRARPQRLERGVLSNLVNFESREPELLQGRNGILMLCRWKRQISDDRANQKLVFL